MGGDQFCIKVCDAARPNASSYCEHVYDRIGCAFNAPSAVQNGTFQSCQGDNMDFPGVYVEGGQTMTYHQPPESLGPITSMPYTARIPASSNCVPYQSAQLYSALPTATVTKAPTTSAGSGSSGRATSNGSGTRAGSAPTSTGTTNGAGQLAVSGIAGLMGVVFAVVAFA
jgi:hypothetical protein